MINLMGSKRDLIRYISAAGLALPGIRRTADLFAGTTRVGQEFKRHGLWVHSNDIATWSTMFGRTYIATDARAIDPERVTRLLAELAALPPVRGFLTTTYCESPSYFSPENGMRADAIRAGIDRLAADETEHALLLAMLMEAMNRVNSTSGSQMAALAPPPPRYFHPLDLRPPRLISGPGAVSQLDANRLAPQLDDIDLAYADPPYTTRSYALMYHIWETVCRNDAPETYGVTRRRLDGKTEKSAYNQRATVHATYADLIGGIRARFILASTSDEAMMSPAALTALLRERGYVASVAIPHKRFNGSQNGIYNQAGEKVGRPGEKTNSEFLILCGPQRSVVETAMDAARRRLPPVQRGLFDAPSSGDTVWPATA